MLGGKLHVRGRGGLPVRHTARLVLRPWLERDRAPFAAINADPEVMEFFPSTLTRAESDALIDTFRANAARRGFGMFAVEQRETGTFLGMVGLTLPDLDAPFMPAVEIGWRFARSAWGQGFATEAARDVLSWALNGLRLPRVVSFTVYENERSWRVMERIGLTHVDDAGRPVPPKAHGQYAHLLYAATPSPRP